MLQSTRSLRGPLVTIYVARLRVGVLACKVRTEKGRPASAVMGPEEAPADIIISTILPRGGVAGLFL